MGKLTNTHIVCRHSVQLFVHPRYLIYLILRIVELLLYLCLAVLQPSDGVVGIIDNLLHRWQPTNIHANDVRTTGLLRDRLPGFGRREIRGSPEPKPPASTGMEPTFMVGIAILGCRSPKKLYDMARRESRTAYCASLVTYTKCNDKFWMHGSHYTLSNRTELK